MTAPIPTIWKRETCAACGAEIRRLELANITVMLDPTPVATLSERIERSGAITGYEHRVGYQPHRCA